MEFMGRNTVDSYYSMVLLEFFLSLTLGEAPERSYYSLG